MLLLKLIKTLKRYNILDDHKRIVMPIHSIRLKFYNNKTVHVQIISFRFGNIVTGIVARYTCKIKCFILINFGFSLVEVEIFHSIELNWHTL